VDENNREKSLKKENAEVLHRSHFVNNHGTSLYAVLAPLLNFKPRIAS
jgi:hypothetical protein